jgi:hypothetical protein
LAEATNRVSEVSPSWSKQEQAGASDLRPANDPGSELTTHAAREQGGFVCRALRRFKSASTFNSVVLRILWKLGSYPLIKLDEFWILYQGLSHQV